MPIRKAQGWPSRANFQRTRNTPAVISVTTSPATPPAGPATLPIPLAICVMPRPTMKCSLASNIIMAEFRTEKMATAISHPAAARIRDRSCNFRSAEAWSTRLVWATAVPQRTRSPPCCKMPAPGGGPPRLGESRGRYHSAVERGRLPGYRDIWGLARLGGNRNQGLGFGPDFPDPHGWNPGVVECVGQSGPVGG